MRAESNIEPRRVQIENENDFANVWLRKNVEETLKDDQIVYTYDEVFFKTQARKNLEKIISGDFEAWYSHGENEVSPKEAVEVLLEENKKLKQAVLDLTDIVLERG